MKDKKIFTDSESIDNSKSYTRQLSDSLPYPKCVTCGEPLIKIQGWRLYVCGNGCLDYLGDPLKHVDYRDLRFGVGDFLYAH